MFRARRRLWGIAIIAASVELWGFTAYLGRVWGSTKAERQRVLPGDDLVPTPHLVTDHGVDIRARPEEIWPWLVQMGWGRGGWYTYEWLDRLLFPANRPSADDVLAQHQSLSVGDRIMDGPPESGCYFTVERLEQHRHLVLFSQTHLPPRLREREGYALRFSWTFVLEPLTPGRTRLHFRSRSTIRPLWLRLAYGASLLPADFIMARAFCMGLKSRIEAAEEPVANG